MSETPPPRSAKPLGRAIRRVRNRKGLSIAAVAERGGLDPGYLTNIELGKANPTLRKLEDTADGLDVSVFDLLCFDRQEGSDDDHSADGS